MCLEYKKHFMVNLLHDHYIEDKGKDAAKQAFENYTRIINENLETHHPERVRYKWWWFKEYMESELKRNPFIENRPMYTIDLRCNA